MTTTNSESVDVSLGSALHGVSDNDLHRLLLDVTQRRNHWAVAQTVVLPQLCMILTIIVALFAFETFGAREQRDNQIVVSITAALQGLSSACGVYVNILSKQKAEMAAELERRNKED